MPSITGLSKYQRIFADAGDRRYGGQGGIRTLDGREPILVFETSAFNLSATCPYMGPKRGKPLYKGVLGIFQGFVGGLRWY